MFGKKRKSGASGAGGANKFSANKVADQSLPEDEVHFKPLFGIRPGVYLACFYLIVICAVFFFIFFFPGIRNPEGVLIVRSEPEGAAVYVDGVYQAATPADIRAPKGARVVRVSLPGFAPWEEMVDVKARAAGSLFFPKRTPVYTRLETRDAKGVLMAGAAEYAAWSFTGEPTAAYQIPLSLSESAYRAAPAAKDAETRAAMNGTLEAAARFASTTASARDLMRAKYLLDNAGLAPSPVTLVSTAEDALSYLSQNPASADILLRFLPPESAAALKESAWYKKNTTVKTEPPAAVPPTHGVDSGGYDVNGVVFIDDITAKSGEYSYGAYFSGYAASEKNFYIGGHAVTPQEWAVFIDANPEWRQENRAALMEKGLVNEDYLAEIDVANDTQTCVSWYAAQAYCAWLTTFLSNQTLEIRFPREAEWEYVAALFQADSDSEKAVWCEDYFAPFAELSAPAESVAALGSPERSVRGGASGRGALPPDFCSPFVSFRPIIAAKTSGRP